jgi:hypothetical protein
MGKDEEKEIVIRDFTSDSWKGMKLDCGAERHHYSMFKVRCSTFIFQNNPEAAPILIDKSCE